MIYINKYSILIVVFILSCQPQNKNHLVTAEKVIEKTYSSGFSDFSGNVNNQNPIELYERIEYYYLLNGLIKNRTKEAYAKFHDNYISKDVFVDLECLYKSSPEIEYLILPSNLTHNFYSFEKGVESLKSINIKESELIKTNEALLAMMSGMNLVFKDSLVNMNYLNSIESDKFENNIIYRLPLIAFSHYIFSERYQQKIIEERRKRD
ncbi:MAG: hypothetical protein L3J06_06635 [Cyclobacteriaceae bacterium]|nr:hypothetical protein [Cyclobacteriaceae bacterium]